MLQKYIKGAGDLLFPLTCLSCRIKIKQGQLCHNCYEKIKFLEPCESKLYPYLKVISATEYKEPVNGLVQLFKYQNCDYLGKFLAQLMIKHLKNIGFSAQGHNCIIAVPLHRYKLKIRGYNQAEVLANFISNHFKIPLRNDIMSVARFKPSQTKLDKPKRQNNLKGVFKVNKTVKNLNLILVDDIFTTGSTILACSEALKEKGVNSITTLTLSKTISNKPRKQS